MSLPQRILRAISGLLLIISNSFLGSNSILWIHSLYSQIISINADNDYSILQSILLKGLCFLISLTPIILILFSILMIIIGIYSVFSVFTKSSKSKHDEDEYNDYEYKEI